MATFTTIASSLFLFTPSSAAGIFGLPRHTSPGAIPWIRVLGGRSFIIALSLWTFLYQGNVKAIGVIVMSATTSAVIDAIICIREGDVGKGWGHGIAGIGMALSGLWLSNLK